MENFSKGIKKFAPVQEWNHCWWRPQQESWMVIYTIHLYWSLHFSSGLLRLSKEQRACWQQAGENRLRESLATSAVPTAGVVLQQSRSVRWVNSESFPTVSLLEPRRGKSGSHSELPSHSFLHDETWQISVLGGDIMIVCDAFLYAFLYCQKYFRRKKNPYNNIACTCNQPKKKILPGN